LKSFHGEYQKRLF